ncbi:MAG: putative metal-binding motif-containing protein [Nanoarchaeota archaeon]
MAVIKTTREKKYFPFALIIGLVTIAVFLAFFSISDFTFSGGVAFGGGGGSLPSGGGLENVLPPVTPPVTAAPLIAVNNLQVLGTPGQRAIALGFELPCNRDTASAVCDVISDYEVRWRTDGAIISNNWDSAYIGAKYCNSIPGQISACTLVDQQTEKEAVIDKAIGGGPSEPTRLEPDTTYYLAVKYLVDGRWSPISNIVIATTAEAPPSICAGNARGCNTYELEPNGQALCSSQQGCTWNANGLPGLKCTGTATTCSAITNDLVCGKQAGCKWHVDSDRDTFYSDTDCNDNDADINPSKTEVCGNSVDDNCNGKIDAAEDICKETVGAQNNQTTDTGGGTNIIQDTTGTGGGSGGDAGTFPRDVEESKTNKKITSQILDADADDQVIEEEVGTSVFWWLLLLAFLVAGVLAYYKYVRPKMMQRNGNKYVGYKEY